MISNISEHDPECTVQPNKTVKDGEDVVLTCTINLDTNAPGDLVWLKNGKEVSRKEGQNNTWETQLNRSDDNAIFDCQLQHYTLPPGSEISCGDKIQADVQYLSVFNMAVTPSTTVKERERFTIDYTAQDGNPGPSNMTLSREEEIVISNDGLDIRYTISRISKLESGVYKCEANTEFYDGSYEYWSREKRIVVHSEYIFSSGQSLRYH
ncbi:cell adhesion molecule 2-like [Ptychodera flava]|uniref:cell adhesion molecule 2-like n=1 Tax=Ptychodera flava TaxID=63121 RepID=UPI00396A440E